MKTIVLLALAIPTAALAQWRPLETNEEARQRQDAGRARIYEERGHQAPLGGYPERLGNPGGPSSSSTPYTPPRREDPAPTTPDAGERLRRGGGYLEPVVPNRR